MTTSFLFVPVFNWPTAPGGKLHTYAAGGTTPQTTWSDAPGSVPNANPITLDSNGTATVRLTAGLAYHMVLKDSTDTTTLWDADNYQSSYLTQSDVGGLLYPQVTGESAAGVTPTNYAYVPGDIRRYGNADPTGVSDSTAAIDAVNALAGSMVIYGGGVQCSYKTSHSLKLQNFAEFDGQGCKIHLTADVPGITNATGAAVLYARIRNVSILADLAITNAALDLVDVNRSTFIRVQIDRGISSMSWAYGIRLRTSASTCLWNRFFDVECDVVTIGFISIETANCNQNVFFGCKLINDATIKLPFGIKITLGGDNYFFDADLEASFSTNGAGNAYGVNFNSGTQNRIFGLRTEGYTNSASFYGVNYAGAAGANEVWGHYFTGFGATSAFNGLIAGNTYVGSGYTYTNPGSLTGLKGEIGWDSVADRFKGTTNAGGQRLVVQSPALDAVNMNGNAITGIAANSSGWGTPTGAIVVNNFPGASATLVQCSETLAAVINALKSLGIFGA